MNSKTKGSGYEREICKKLSLWVSNGRATDIFWRSSLSGGRATVAHRKGQVVRQTGDICAVSPEGFALCGIVYLECKHVRSLDIESFLFKGKGMLAKFWKTAVLEAEKHGREPLIIARQNRFPDLAISFPHVFKALTGRDEIAGHALASNAVGRAPVQFRLLSDLLATPFNVKGSL